MIIKKSPKLPEQSFGQANPGIWSCVLQSSLVYRSEARGQFPVNAQSTRVFSKDPRWVDVKQGAAVLQCPLLQ